MGGGHLGNRENSMRTRGDGGVDNGSKEHLAVHILFCSI